MFLLASGVQFENLELDGDGGNFTGRGFVIDSATSDQRFINVNVLDMDGYCLEFPNNAGTRSVVLAGKWNRTGLGDAIKCGTDDSGTGGRFFTNIFTGGGRLIDLGGSRVSIVVACKISGITFGSSCANATVIGCRWAESNIVIDGSSHRIEGNSDAGSSVTVNGSNCIIFGNSFPGLTLSSGAAGNQIIGNNIPSVTDSSGVTSNLIIDSNIISNIAKISSAGVPLVVDSTNSQPRKIAMESAGVLEGSIGTNASQCLRVFAKDDAIIASFSNDLNIVNSLDFAGGTTGNNIKFSAVGSDTDIDIAIRPQGDGKVQFGSHSNIGAETVTGFITIKDSSGTERKLAVVS